MRRLSEIAFDYIERMIHRNCFDVALNCILAYVVKWRPLIHIRHCNRNRIRIRIQHILLGCMACLAWRWPLFAKCIFDLIYSWFVNMISHIKINLNGKLAYAHSPNENQCKSRIKRICSRAFFSLVRLTTAPLAFSIMATRRRERERAQFNHFIH